MCVCSFSLLAEPLSGTWDPGSRDVNPAFWLVEMGHVNELMTYPMLMRHVTLQNNTPIVFLAL